MLFFPFFLRMQLVVVLTLLISQPLMASNIFRHFRHKKKFLVSTAFSLLYDTPAPKIQNHMKTEEVILVPRPPLKGTYTPPSMKVPFPQNQCKSSLSKFTTKSIKTCTSQYNKKMINNLSDHKLTEDESSVFTKGLPSVPTPHQNP